MKRLTKVVEISRLVAEWLSMLLLAAVFVVSLSGVVARYILNQPLAWGEELGMILLVWSVFLADAFVTQDRDHISFDLVWNAAGPEVRRAMLIVQGGLFAALFAAALPTILDYVLFLWRERTSSLKWRLDVVYSCFVLYIALLVVRLVAKVGRAIGRSWRREVQGEDTPVAANIIG